MSLMFINIANSYLKKTAKYFFNGPKQINYK